MSSESVIDNHLETNFLDVSYDIRHSFSKRFFDIAFSLTMLILGSPIFLIISLLIKITSPGTVFYSSPRMGRAGKIIRCWKFRTMCTDAEKKLKEVLSKNPALQEEWNRYYKLKNDPRVTFIGKYLRKTSLDEIPQFWNVLIGDLSLVGPRPFLIDEIQKHLVNRTEKILAVRPGLTGIWQTSGRSLLTFEDRIRLDETYVDVKSFLFDLKIILKTIPVLFFQKGAY